MRTRASALALLLLLCAAPLWAAGTLVGHGTPAFSATSGAAVSPGLPTGFAAGDVHVMACHNSGNVLFNTPSGWSIVAGLDDDNTAAQRVTVFWRRAAAGDSAPSVSMASAVTTVRGCVIIGVRGAVVGGYPFDRVGRTLNAAAATITFPSVDTTFENAFLLAIGAYEDDPSARTTPGTWTQPASSVLTSALGNDASLNYFHKTQASPGATGGFTTTVSTGTFANSVSVGAVLAVIPEPDCAAPTVCIDAVTMAPGTDQAANSFSHTVGAGGDFLFACVSLSEHTATMDSGFPKYNGVSMTLIAETSIDSGIIKTLAYGLVSPATGANTFETQATGVAWQVALLASYNGVDPTTPYGTAATAAGVGDVQEVVVPAAVGKLVVDCMNSRDNGTSTYTIGAGQLPRAFHSDPGFQQLRISEEAGAANVPMSWSWAAEHNEYYATAGVPLNPVAASTTTRRRITMH